MKAGAGVPSPPADCPRHYGTLIGGAHAGMIGRLDAIEAELEQAAEGSAETTE